MKRFQLLFAIIATMIGTSLAFAQPIPVHVGWPEVLTNVPGLDALENPAGHQYFLLDQAAINDLADEFGVVHLENQNIAADAIGDDPEEGMEIDPAEYYDEVDYIIVSDLRFGDGDDEADVNLVIDEGVTIWFGLSSRFEANSWIDGNNLQFVPRCGQIDIDTDLGEEAWYGFFGITEVCKISHFPLGKSIANDYNHLR